MELCDCEICELAGIGDWSWQSRISSLCSLATDHYSPNNFSSCPIAQSRPTALPRRFIWTVRVVPHKDGATFGTGEYASKALRTERWTKLKILS